MADVLTPDICVIGGGAGGLAAATEARRLGASVVLVERGRLGGTALNAGAIPARALAAAARRAQYLRTAAPFGIANADPKVNARGVFDHVHDVVNALTPMASPEYLAAQGITLIEAEAVFVDRKTLAAGEQHVRAGHFIIATGSRPLVPEIAGLASVPFFNSRSILDNPRKLTHLLVVGAGLTGLELAQSYRRLGSDVTVVDSGTPLADCDPELAEIVLRRLAEEGIAIRPDTGVTGVEARSLGIGVTVRSGDRDEVLDVSHILVATGHRPDIEALEVRRAGVTLKPGSSDLVLDAGLRTANPQVYAIGDAAGGAPSTRAASQQATIVVRNLVLGEGRRFDPLRVPRVTCTDPEIAEVGLTEPMAKAERRTGYRVLRRSLAENDRARAERQTYGLVKVIVDARGRILGAGIAGTGAGELIALFAFAIANRLSLRHFDSFAAAYPSLSEVASDLAAEFRGDTPAPGPLATMRRALRQARWPL